MDELSQNDYVVIDDFIKPPLFTTIRTFFLNHIDLFSKAGIGALDQNIIRRDIRGDLTYWLDRDRDAELKEFWSLVDETIGIYNRYCFLGLSGYELHLAHYPSGGHYDRHLDRFNNRSNRLISFVLYLNEGWQKGDGGELELYLNDGSYQQVEPIQGRCIMFKSAIMEHSVLKAHKDRYSLTGWLLQKPAALGQFLG